MTRGWTFFAALALVAAGALYIQLRWRRSPYTYRAMVALAGCCFVAGALARARVLRISAKPAPSPSRRIAASPAPSTALTPAQSSSPFPSLGYNPARAVLPDAKLTSGATIPGVTTADVCTPGWATEHRQVTEVMRAQVYREYGYNYDSCQGPERGVLSESCKVDHLIALELGGSNDIKNLWPQPYSREDRKNCTVYDPRPGAAEKDQLENELHHLVCSGKMTLADAWRCIASN